MNDNIRQKTKYLLIVLVSVIVSITCFNFVVLEQENILRRYFIIAPQERQKEFNSSLSNSLVKYFVKENKAADPKQAEEYIKRYGRTSLFDLYFIFRDKDGIIKQISKSGITSVSREVTSGENVYPVSIDNGRIEGYFMVMIKEDSGAETKEGFTRYRVLSYSLKFIFLLLVTALAIIIFYYDYSAKMKLARDMAEIKASNDGLTGLHTHEYFTQALEIETAKVNIYNTPLALLMLDIDYFKELNDRYGHLAGDKVLQEASNMIKLSTRATDTLARYGGEEFAIIIPYVAKPGDMRDANKKSENFLNEIKIVAERIRKNIEDCGAVYSSNVLKVTVSIGVAFYYKKFYNTTATALLEKADKALYEAKKLGRNRVYVAS